MEEGLRNQYEFKKIYKMEIGMIKKFACENFRNISKAELDFARINILIGPNNAGKSNFIRALSFAANMVSPHPGGRAGFSCQCG